MNELDRSYTQRRKPAEGGNRGSDVRKRIKGKETIGYASLYEFLKANAELKRKAKNREEWKIWKQSSSCFHKNTNDDYQWRGFQPLKLPWLRYCLDLPKTGKRAVSIKLNN